MSLLGLLTFPQPVKRGPWEIKFVTARQRAAANDFE
jgi:hypothetical protein